MKAWTPSMTSCLTVCFHVRIRILTNVVAVKTADMHDAARFATRPTLQLHTIMPSCCLRISDGLQPAALVILGLITVFLGSLRESTLYYSIPAPDEMLTVFSSTCLTV
jgi:hypothetical protein